MSNSSSRAVRCCWAAPPSPCSRPCLRRHRCRQAGPPSPPPTATARPGRSPTSRARSWCSRRRIRTAPTSASTTAPEHADPAARGRHQGRGLADLGLVGTGEEGYVTAPQANDLTKSRNAAPAAVLLDPQSKIARAYGATVTPHMYVIDATGMLVYKGGIDSTRRPTSPNRQGQAVCARRRSTRC